MTPRRPRLDRLVAWSPVLLLGCLAALTYWLDAQVQKPGRRDDGSSRHDPDLYIERFSAVSFDVDGRVRQMLAATRAEHFPDDGSVDLIAPSLELTDPGTPRLTVRADTGTVTGDREIITLLGRVRATRDAAPATARDKNPAGEATFATDMLRVIPKEARAETDKLVTVEEARGIIQGVGMILDNKARTVRIKSAVRGTLQPNLLPK
jgi:lipopolysaccharide export system protein LptC